MTVATQPFASGTLKCGCCLQTGFLAEEIEESGWCMECDDGAQECWRCEERFPHEEIQCVGDGWLCDECNSRPTASSRRQRDPDAGRDAR